MSTTDRTPSVADGRAAYRATHHQPDQPEQAEQDSSLPSINQRGRLAYLAKHGDVKAREALAAAQALLAGLAADNGDDAA
jgi:hypothetical protein